MAKLLEDDALNIYTDGSSLVKPRRGAFGVLFIQTDKIGNELFREETVSRAYRGGRNNTMELLACVEALKSVFDLSADKFTARRIYIFTDSKYVCDNEARAAFEWPGTKWTKRGGAPVANALEWKELTKIRAKLARKGRQVRFKWVKGHANNPGNKRVDAIARHAAKTARIDHFSREGLRRKHSKQTTKVGSIKMVGQEELVHIIGHEFLKIQKKHKYRYEIFNQEKKCFTDVDFAYSDINLKEGHYYRVVFNSEQENPTITNDLGEVENPLKTDIPDHARKN